MSQPPAIDGARRPRPMPPPPVPQTAPPSLTTPQFARRSVVLLLILILFYVAYQGIDVLLETFAGVLFAVFLSTLAHWVERKANVRYGVALLVVVLALAALASGFGWMLANRLAQQIGELTQQLPRSFHEIQEYLRQFAWGRMLLQQVPHATQSLSENMGGFSRLTGLVSGVASFLEATVVILVVGIFGAAEPNLYYEGILHLIPAHDRLRAAEALDAAVHNLRYWLVGQVALMVMIGATTALGLWLIGVPLALALGCITGIMELVPYIGAWLSAIPAALMALLLGPTELFMTLGLYLGLHVLEGYVLVPLIQKRAVELAPAFTLVMQILLGRLLGFLGLFVAAPLTVVLVVLVKMLYVEDALGDQSIEVPGEGEKVQPPAPTAEAPAHAERSSVQ
jgi:predicted PurR-regulated permease PerM